jgi:hypothetical protein
MNLKDTKLNAKEVNPVSPVTTLKTTIPLSPSKNSQDAIHKAHDTAAGPDDDRYQMLKHLPDDSILVSALRRRAEFYAAGANLNPAVRRKLYGGGGVKELRRRAGFCLLQILEYLS